MGEQEKVEEKVDRIIDIINDESIKVDKKTGIIKWRSSMDAGSVPPDYLGQNIEDILEEWLMEYAYGN